MKTKNWHRESWPILTGMVPVDVEAGKLEECGFWREWCDGWPGQPQRVILRRYCKDRSLRKVTGDKITENSSFPRYEKKWGKKKKKKKRRKMKPQLLLERKRKKWGLVSPTRLEHTGKPQWIQWGANMKTGREIEAAGPRVSGIKHICMWNPGYDKGAISNGSR